MNTYHILLLYPEHITNYYGDTYLSDPIATDRGYNHAIAQARRDCAASNEQPEDWADNFTVLLIVKNGEIL